MYSPAATRYDSPDFYRRCGRSGVKLPIISLGLWHNFGGVDTFENGRAMLRRAPPPPVSGVPTGPVQLGLLTFDTGRAELRGPAGPVRLTGGEASLLLALALRANEILSREELSRAAFRFMNLAVAAAARRRGSLSERSQR